MPSKQYSRFSPERIASIATVIVVGISIVYSIAAIVIDPEIDPSTLNTPVKEMFGAFLWVRHYLTYVDFTKLLAAISVISAAAAVFFYSRFKHELEKAKRNKGRFQRTVKNISTFGWEFNKKEMEIICNVILSLEKREPLEVAVHNLLNDMCTFIADTFHAVTDKQCHCTIKLFGSDDGNYLTTAARDTLPHNRERGIIDTERQLIDYKNDTGFASIIDRPDLDFFICNDLKKDFDAGIYINENQGWNEKYNATIISPICRDRAARKIKRDTVIGFISVDSMEAEFPRDVSKHILSFYSSQIHAIIKIIESVPGNEGTVSVKFGTFCP